jgi:hypothetical protein
MVDVGKVGQMRGVDLGMGARYQLGGCMRIV